MKKIFLCLISVIFLVFVATTMIACDGSDFVRISYYADDTYTSITYHGAYVGEYYQLPVEEKEGHTFLGYFDSAEGGSQIIGNNGVSLLAANKSSNPLLYPIWKPKEYVINVVSATTGAPIGSPITVSYGQTMEDSVVTLTGQLFPILTEGYEYAGLFTARDGTGTQVADATSWLSDYRTFNYSSFPDNGTNEYTLYAQASIKKFTVSFYNDDVDLLGEAIVPYGTVLNSENGKQYYPDLSSYESDYQHFARWDNSQWNLYPHITADTPITNDIAINAGWEYTVRFVLSGGASFVNGSNVYSITGPAGTPVDIPEINGKVGYDFSHWEFNASPLADNFIIPKNGGSIYSVWTPRTDIRYIVNHKIQGVDLDYFFVAEHVGTADEPVLDKASILSLDSNSVMGYYSAIYPTSYSITNGIDWENPVWVEESDSMMIAPDGSTVLTYLYPRKTYKIIYHVDNNVYSTQSYLFLDVTSKSTPTPTKEGYVFSKWELDITKHSDYSNGSNFVLGNEMPSYDIHYNAVFQWNSPSAYVVKGDIDNSDTWLIMNMSEDSKTDTIDISSSFSSNFLNNPAYKFDINIELDMAILKNSLYDTVPCIKIRTSNGKVLLLVQNIPYINNSSTTTAGIPITYGTYTTSFSVNGGNGLTTRLYCDYFNYIESSFFSWVRQCIKIRITAKLA